MSDPESDPESLQRRSSTRLTENANVNPENPLVDREPWKLDDDVKTFYKNCDNPLKKNCESKQKIDEVVALEELQKGAKVAQARGQVELTPAEEKAINDERVYEWFYQTRELRGTILVTACAAITQGWQQSTINASGPMGMRNALGLPEEEQDIGVLKGKLLWGLLNAAPWLSGSLVGTWMSDPLQEGRFGRRPALFIAAIFCIACVIGTARSNSWQELLIFRMLLGIGIGTKASVAPVFAAEAAPNMHRGRILMMWQLFDALGIFLGFVSALVVNGSWRALLASAMIPPAILLFLVFLCPESPRFLIRRGAYAEAYKSLRQLRGTDIQAARDLYYIHSQLQVETTIWTTLSQPWYEGFQYQEWIRSMSFLKRVWLLFTTKRNQRACSVAFLVMISQQLCGINVLAFYSSEIFSQHVSSSANDAAFGIEWFNFCFGFACFFFTIPAYLFIDSWGRRPLLLISLGGTTLSLLALGAFFFIKDHELERALISSFTIVVFTFFYSIGAGPIPFTLSAEVFPLCFREVGMSFSVMVNFFGLGILILGVPWLASVWGGSHPHANILFLFSGLSLLAFILAVLFVPETNHVELEQMNKTFQQPTRGRVEDHIEELKNLDRFFRKRS